MDRAPTPTIEQLVYSVPEFCTAAGIAVRTFHALRQRGDAPPVVRIGRRLLIRRETAAKWLAERETA